MASNAEGTRWNDTKTTDGGWEYTVNDMSGTVFGNTMEFIIGNNSEMTCGSENYLTLVNHTDILLGTDLNVTVAGTIDVKVTKGLEYGTNVKELHAEKAKAALEHKDEIMALQQQILDVKEDAIEANRTYVKGVYDMMEKQITTIEQQVEAMSVQMNVMSEDTTRVLETVSAELKTVTNEIETVSSNIKTVEGEIYDSIFGLIVANDLLAIGE